MGSPSNRSRLLVLGCSAVVASCGSPSSGATESSSRAAGAVVVFAASSLTEAFTEIAEAFEAEHPEVSVTFNFAGSGDLARQIAEGAPADVFAAADDVSMSTVTEAGAIDGAPVIVARNSMAILVEAGNPVGIHQLADLAAPGLSVVVCDVSVPCGRATTAVLTAAGVGLTPKSLEDRVKGVVTKVTTGEADAGIVFVTDVVAAASDADGVDIDPRFNVSTPYPIAVTSEGSNTTAGQAFVDYVSSTAGQEVMAKWGFLAP